MVGSCSGLTGFADVFALFCTEGVTEPFVPGIGVGSKISILEEMLEELDELIGLEVVPVEVDTTVLEAVDEPVLDTTVFEVVEVTLLEVVVETVLETVFETVFEAIEFVVVLIIADDSISLLV